MKKFYTVLAGLIVAAGSIFLFNFLGGISQAALPRDCDNNSIIYCGGITASELATRYKENKTGDLDNIYSNYGLSANDMTHAGTVAKMGEVRKDGKVVVGGKTVATGAQSLGRHNMSGSHVRTINGVKYYERPTSVSFASNAIVAYVFFDANGNFRAAVLTSCGNPVTAKSPVYKCDSLASKMITRTKYTFTAAASASNGASITSYTYDFGDGKKTTTTAKTIDHEYAAPGTYTVKLSVTMNVNGTAKTVTGANCQKTVKVEELPPTYVCDSLTASKISRLEYAFDGKATVTGSATIVNYLFDFGDTKTQTVTSPANVKHTYEKAGSYTAKLSVTVKVDNVTKTVTSAKCQVPVKVEDIPVTPTYVCDSLTASKISRLETAFTGKATTAGGAIVENYVFDFGDTKTQTVTNPVNVKHTYAKEGEYTAKLTVNVKVNNETKSVTGPSCIVKVTIASEECKPGVPVGDDRCKEECKPGIPVGDDRCKEECKPGIPVGDIRCEEKPEECKPGIPVNDDRCKEECKPGIPVEDERCEEVPAELPKTGPMDMLFGTFGLGSVAAAAYYYVASRRGLLAELLQR